MTFNQVLQYLPSIGDLNSLMSGTFSLLWKVLGVVWQYPLYSFIGLTVFTWVYYLAMCTLKRAYKAGTLPTGLKPLAYVLLVIFLFFDLLFNVTVGTIVFWQLPKQALFTTRCKENKLVSGWRAAEARWWCRVMLNPFDPSGKHC